MREEEMAPPIDKRAIRAVALLKEKHPKHPDRCYTVREAAKKTGAKVPTIYRHIEKQRGEKA